MLIFAHRGASADAPENTLLAFRIARAQGADGVELDVRRTASGDVVVVHDADLWRVAGARLAVARTHTRELRGVDLGHGERVPLLAEALEELSDLAVNVEVKCGTLDDHGLTEAVLRCIAARGGGETASSPSATVVVSSFNPAVLVRARLLSPLIPLALLYAPDEGPRYLRRPWTLGVPALALQAVHPRHDQVDAPRMRAWRRRGLAVRAWTVDDPAEARRLSSLGVDAVITNRPRFLRDALAAAQ